MQPTKCVLLAGRERENPVLRFNNKIMKLPNGHDFAAGVDNWLANFPVMKVIPSHNVRPPRTPTVLHARGSKKARWRSQISCSIKATDRNMSKNKITLSTRRQTDDFNTHTHAIFLFHRKLYGFSKTWKCKTNADRIFWQLWEQIWRFSESTKTFEHRLRWFFPQIKSKLCT